MEFSLTNWNLLLQMSYCKDFFVPVEPSRIADGNCSFSRFASDPLTDASTESRSAPAALSHSETPPASPENIPAADQRPTQ